MSNRVHLHQETLSPTNTLSENPVQQITTTQTRTIELKRDGSLDLFVKSLEQRTICNPLSIEIGHVDDTVVESIKLLLHHISTTETITTTSLILGHLNADIILSIPTSPSLSHLHIGNTNKNTHLTINPQPSITSLNLGAIHVHSHLLIEPEQTNFPNLTSFSHAGCYGIGFDDHCPFLKSRETTLTTTLENLESLAKSNSISITTSIDDCQTNLNIPSSEEKQG